MARSSSPLPLLLGALALIVAGGAAFLWLLPADVTDDGPTPVVSRVEDDVDASAPRTEIEAYDGSDRDRGAPDEPQSPRVGVLIGQLVNVDRRPVPEGRVELLEGTPLGLGGVGHLPRLGPRGAVDAQGRFRLEDVPVSDQVVVRAIGDSFEITDSGPFLVRPGETCDVGALIVAPGVTVHGTVSDPRGRGVAGAQVALARGETLAVGRDGVDPERVVITDERGEYSIPHASHGLFRLVVSAEGFGTAEVIHGVQLEPPSQIEMNVRLLPATPLEGLVLLPGGVDPAVNVEVLAEGGEPGRGNALVRTDAKGRFRFADLAAGRHVLHVDPVGYLPESEVILSGAFEDGVTIELRPASGLRGTVEDLDGRPVKAFDLQLRESNKRGIIGGAVGASRRVRDGQGRFEVDDLEPGWYLVEVWARGHAVTLSDPVVVRKNGRIAEISVTLQQAATLAGSVVDDLGQPIADARISLHSNNTPTFGFLRASASRGSWHGSTRTDDQGLFELTEVTARTYQIEVDHPRYPVVHHNDVAIEAGERRELAPVVLDRPAVLTGAVIDASGQLLKGVTVTLGGGKNRATRQVVSDGEGRYRFERLAPGGYQVHAYAPDSGPMDVLFSSISRLKRDPEGNPVLPSDVELAPGEEREYTITAQG